MEEKEKNVQLIKIPLYFLIYYYIVMFNNPLSISTL